MQELYTQQTLDALRAQIRKRRMALLFPLLVLAGVLVFSCVQRIEWLSVVSSILICFLLVFAVEMFFRPLRAYEKLLEAALHGRSHEGDFVFSHAEPEVSVVDGVSCLSLIFLGDPDKHGTREQMFYWDRELSLPAFQKGQNVRLRYTGTMITAWQSA